ncbi:MAG: hypothetical protein ACI4D7_02530 [Lachnospiraceae bacterium]
MTLIENRTENEKIKAHQNLHWKTVIRLIKKITSPTAKAYDTVINESW